MKGKNQIDGQERSRLRGLFERQDQDETRLTPGYQTHEQLWVVAKRLPSDYEPWGQVDRGWHGDCSCGCR